MDYLMSQGVFVYGDGSLAGVSGYTAIRDILVNNWGTEIQTYGDSIENHHHFMIYDGTWKRYDNGPDAGYPDYQMYALDHMIIDRNFYPSTWRSGWLVMTPSLSNWLEQWTPFDYTPLNGVWYPVHPYGMNRWTTPTNYGASQSNVNEAFTRARDYGSAIYSIYTHTNENMANQINSLQSYLNTADANEATYPNVSFKYVSAREAMQRALGFTDFTPPTFTVTVSGGAYTITSSEPLWANHPYVALKYTDGTYTHMGATPAGTNTWTVTPPAGTLAKLGIAASDQYGNPGVWVDTPMTAAINPTYVKMYVGQSQTFNSSVSGGTPPYAYQWYLNDTAVPGATSSAWTFTPRSTGNYKVYLRVTDGLNFKVQSNVVSDVFVCSVHLLLTVDPNQATYVRSHSVTFTVNVFNQLDPALESTLTLTVTGPSGYYFYDFQTINVSAGTVREYSFSWNIPNVAGTYFVEVELVPSMLTAYDMVWLGAA